VAEFIGDSNLFTGTIDAVAPGTIVLDGLGAIQADAAACRRIGPRRVDVLVRPERVRLVDAAAASTHPNRIALTVDVVVNYGDSALVIGTAAGRRLRMRVGGGAADRLREGAVATVSWDPGDVHVIER
jgi:ABC-type Fe3+/spermidine/putrescine transport system ATPase subunit